MDLEYGRLDQQFLESILFTEANTSYCLAEQIPSVNRYARKTKRMAAQQTEIAFSAGGEPGACLTMLLQIPTTPVAVLRYI